MVEDAGAAAATAGEGAVETAAGVAQPLAAITRRARAAGHMLPAGHGIRRIIQSMFSH